MNKFIITNSMINLIDFIKAANDFSCVISYDEIVRKQIIESRQILEDLVENGKIIYGVNTGMGGFVNFLVPTEHAEKLQNNLLQSVATNVGDYFDDYIVRTIMLARLISLSKGASAISIENFEVLLKMINANILPCVPTKGSLGASGDLGPLAFIALAGVGKWKAKYKGKIVPGDVALKQAGIKPMCLHYKEGLALVNGTSAMVGLATNVYNSAYNLLQYYEYISALTFEGLQATKDPLNPVVHKMKKHKGQHYFAKKVWDILCDSTLATNESDRELSIQMYNEHEVKGVKEQIEDAYSLRCTPQILGPIYDSIEFICEILQNELNSVSDNPLIITSEKRAFHNGHFHGQYISVAMDILSINLTTLSNLSDRRIDRFMDKNNSNGLPPFLCKEEQGLRMGLMGGQFMSTSITAENRALCVPLSIQTLPSTGDFQDIVSFGLIAARRCSEILNNVIYVISFEVLCACQAVEMRETNKMSYFTHALFEEIRKIVPYLKQDITINPYIEAIHKMFSDNILLNKLKRIEYERSR